MATYSDVKKQIAQLETKAAELRKAEVAQAIADIRAKMDEYDLTINDIAKGKRGRPAATKRTVKKSNKPAKYMDPATGKTWTGQGKPPAWIAKATNRESFLIDRVQTAKKADAPKSAAAKPVQKKTKTAAAKPAAAKKPVVKTVTAKKPVKKAAPVKKVAAASKGQAVKAGKAGTPAKTVAA